MNSPTLSWLRDATVPDRIIRAAHIPGRHILEMFSSESPQAAIAPLVFDERRLRLIERVAVAFQRFPSNWYLFRGTLSRRRRDQDAREKKEASVDGGEGRSGRVKFNWGGFRERSEPGCIIKARVPCPLALNLVTHISREHLLRPFFLHKATRSAQKYSAEVAAAQGTPNLAKNRGGVTSYLDSFSLPPSLFFSFFFFFTSSFLLRCTLRDRRYC